MLLAIDAGNTNIVCGLFAGAKLLKQWRQPTGEPLKFPRELRVGKVVIASVVPQYDAMIRKLVKKKFNLIPHFVTARNITGLKIALKNKAAIGADRVVNAFAAYHLYGGPAIIVDFGTATTFDLVSAKGEYLGGAIAPGVLLSRDALYQKTAKLPKIKIAAPGSVIGKNTVQAMQSGLVYGYVAMVEGMIDRIKCQMSNVPALRDPESLDLIWNRDKCQMKVVATGGLAGLICKYTKVVDTIDPDLTLSGLRLIGTVAK